jgi:hypothetical protein
VLPVEVRYFLFVHLLHEVKLGCLRWVALPVDCNRRLLTHLVLSRS